MDSEIVGPFQQLVLKVFKTLIEFKSSEPLLLLTGLLNEGREHDETYVKEVGLRDEQISSLTKEIAELEAKLSAAMAVKKAAKLGLKDAVKKDSMEAAANSNNEAAEKQTFIIPMIPKPKVATGQDINPLGALPDNFKYNDPPNRIYSMNRIWALRVACAFHEAGYEWVTSPMLFRWLEVNRPGVTMVKTPFSQAYSELVRGHEMISTKIKGLGTCWRVLPQGFELNARAIKREAEVFGSISADVEAATAE